MRNYVYLVEVSHRHGWWVTEVHYSHEGSQVVAQDMWKFMAVAGARRLCRGLAENQGTNRRLELQVRTKDGRIKIKDSYGSDPRSIRG